MDIKIKKFQDLNKIIPILTYQRINDEKSIVVSHKKLLFTLNCLKLHFGYQYSLLSSSIKCVILYIHSC